MGTYCKDSEQVRLKGDHDDRSGPSQNTNELDAGALFVLESKGSWVDCGCHLTTSIVAPPLLSLPYAFVYLGWAGGMLCLVAGAVVSFYSYNLLSMVLEHHAQMGGRHLRFRDMAYHILGPRWGRYFVGPIQFAVCYGAVVGVILLGGECTQAIYLLLDPEGKMKLYEFMIIFGVVVLILSQMPSFHSLRHISMISLVLCLCYSACATAGSIYIGNTHKQEEKDYLVLEDTEDRAFGIFNAIAIIATTYGNGIIPEIQATLAPPVQGKMFKGLCLCYAVLLVTFFSVAVSGYWAFGSQAQGQVLSNFIANGKALLPKWFIFMSNAFVILQLLAVAAVYLQPTNELLETTLADPRRERFALRNVIPRLISRSLSIIVATTFAVIVPSFGDINAFVGAFGFLPLDFVLPVVFFNLTFKPSKRSLIFWVNAAVAVVFSLLCAIATLSALRQIILDAEAYDSVATV